jgi:hypothetical protein
MRRSERDNKTMTAMYVKFTEDNEWEGETWHFYIPMTGNEAALARLADALKNRNEDEQYRLDLDSLVPEFEVDVLVKHSDVGYLHYRNKLTGTLVLTDEDLDRIRNVEDHDPLYKGGIRDLMCERKA